MVQTLSGQILCLGRVLAGLLLLASVSSCTVAPEEPPHDLSSLGAKVSFAYDAQIDQLAYMSCSDMSNSQTSSGAYFTFRAGAYRSGGLKLRDSFFEETKRMRPQDREQILAYSPQSQTTSAQLSVRKRGDLRAVFVDGTAVEGRDYDNFFTTLGDLGPIDRYLLNAVDRIRYTRTSEVRGSRFEANLSFRSKAALAEQLRTSLSSDFLLTMTFANAARTSGATLPKSAEELSEDAPLNSAYGVAYNIGFRRPAGQLNGMFPTVVLQGPETVSDNTEGITERNLENLALANSKAKWICPSELQFRIIRKDDLAAVNASSPTSIEPCRILYDDQENPGLLSRKIARLSLRSEDWYMDSLHKCIVSKRAEQDCYGSASSVQYNLRNACNPGGGVNACVQYASVCYRVDN